MKMTKLSAMVLLGISLVGCGQSVDPIKAVARDTFAPLSYFSSNAGTFAGVLTQPFNPSAPFWSFGAGVSIFNGGTYLSPADGTVTQLGLTTINSTQTNFVSIVHTSRLATRFYGLQQITVRQGDFVFQGQAVGIFIGTGTITFQVLLDGNPVCPLSFMGDAFRATFQSLTFNPCQ